MKCPNDVRNLPPLRLGCWVEKASIYRCVVVLGACITLSCFAQFPVPDGFNPGADSFVGAVVVQADGKVVVGGGFTQIAGQNCNRIARLNPDGSLDSNFAAGANSGVNALALQEDGKILVGGGFTTLSGQARNFLGRLQTDGTLDPGFNPGADWVVSCLLVQADGKILVGGGFQTLAGQRRMGLARLNPDGTLDSTFTSDADFGAMSGVAVKWLATQADGKILVGGDFTSLGGYYRPSLGRLNADGTLDNTFFALPYFNVTSFALLADGKVLVGGYPSTVGGPVNGVCRMNADGTQDLGFNSSQNGYVYSTNGYVYSLAVQADGKTVVGGYFNTLGGQPRNGIARLNVDGSLDGVFDSEVGPQDQVSSLTVQADGKTLVSGFISSLGGQPRLQIGRLNSTEPATQDLRASGSLISWLRGGSGPELGRTTFEHSSNGNSWTLLGAGTRIPGGWQLAGLSVPAGGSIRARGYYNGGVVEFVGSAGGIPVLATQPADQTNDFGSTATFTAAAAGSEPLHYEWRRNGVSMMDIGRVTGAQTPNLYITNISGSDAAYYSVVVSNSLGSVTSAVARLTVRDPMLRVSPVSQCREVGGDATLSVAAVGAVPLRYQWWKDGVALAGGTDGSLSLTHLQATDAGSYLVVVTNAYGSLTSAVAVLTVNTVLADNKFDPGLEGLSDASVYSLAAQTDGRILVGGHFLAVDGRSRLGAARLNADGTLDSVFDPKADGGIFWPYVSSIVVQADGRIVLGGLFAGLGGQPRDNIGRLNADGIVDSGFSIGAVLNNGETPYVSSLALQADEKLLVGGYFTSLGGQPRTFAGRLDTNGAADWFDPNAGGTVNTLAIQPDGKVLFGGLFRNLGGQWRYHIARVDADGALDGAFHPVVEGLLPQVDSVVVQADRKILVGGRFSALGGQPRSNIARLNEDGTVDSGFNPAVEGRVSALALRVDGKILVGGEFSTLGGLSRDYIGRLHPDGAVDLTFNPTANARVACIAIGGDGDVLVGGQFTTLGGQPHNRIGRLTNTDPVVDQLDYDGSGLSWLRSGASPEVWRCTFEYSADAMTWTFLGAGTSLDFHGTELS